MIDYIRDLCRKKVLERLNAFKNNEHLPNDILTAILKNYSNNKNILFHKLKTYIFILLFLNVIKEDDDLDIELMTDDFTTLFVAGQETTSNTLSFCFQEIGRNPEIAKKAREEIDRVLGERTEVTFQDVNELKYCTAIFKEAMRLYPPVPMITRANPEEIDVHGIKIPKDTPLVVNIISLFL